MNNELLGRHVRRHRLRQVITLDELAELTGTSKGYLSLFERGRLRYPPQPDKLQRIEDALGLPAGEQVLVANIIRTPDRLRSILAALIRAAPEASLTKIFSPLELDALLSLASHSPQPITLGDPSTGPPVQ